MDVFERLKVPLVVAPMAGGPSSPELVAAAGAAGALGSIAGAYLEPAELDRAITVVRAQTQSPFAINLFVPTPYVEPPAESRREALRRTAQFRDELALPEPVLAPPYAPDFDRQFEVVVRHRPAAFSYVFGRLGHEYARELKMNGIVAIGTATSLDEALALVESGADAIVAQGTEAGGHRGTFDPAAEDPDVTRLELIRQITARVKLPVIGAGGIMTTADVRATLRAGARLVQMGTAFLATTEAGTSPAYQRALLAAAVRPTRLTRAFSGRLARGIPNRFSNAIDAHPESILPFPIQNFLTRDIRRAGVGASDVLSLWSGTGTGPLWTGSVRDLIANLFTEI